jgi:uncharacterized membrane protein
MERMSVLIHRSLFNRPHLLAAIGVGVLTAALLPSGWSQLNRALTAWDAAVWTYLLTMIWTMARADHRRIRAIAARQDENWAVILVALCLAALASLAAIGSELSVIKTLPTSERGLYYLFVSTTLVGSWLLLGMLFCFHYAHLYYNAPAQSCPLRFPDRESHPDYWDFLYFSFTIAVAAQTSDVTVRASSLRKLVLAQSVLSFFFNLVILGMSVNIAAGLINS